MNLNLRKWLHGDRDPIVQRAIVIQDVAPAEVPDKELEAKTVKVRIEFGNEILKLGRRSEELRSALSRSALVEVGGRNAKNSHQ